MSRAAILLLGIAAQCVLTALFIWRVVPSIATDIEVRSRNALGERGINWAQVSVDGRDVLLEGLAPSSRQLDRAMAALRDVHGIRTITDRTSSLAARDKSTAQPEEPLRTTSNVRKTMPPGVSVDEVNGDTPVDVSEFGLEYAFRVERDGDAVVLRGMVPDETERQALVAAATRRFPDTRIDDALMISADPPPDFARAARHAISVASLLDVGAAGLRGEVLFVEGLTVSDRDLDRLRDTLEQALPEGYDLALQIGSRQSISAMMRENPDLASRVGSLPAAAPREPLITVKPSSRLDLSPEAAKRCQDDINAQLAERPIAFDTGSADITGSSTELMESLVALVKGCPATRVEIEGHTDDQGLDENNLALSQRRAEAVMEYFVRNGVKLGRLSAVGYGETRPLVENRTAEDRARNRRIELRVVATDDSS